MSGVLLILLFLLGQISATSIYIVLNALNLLPPIVYKVIAIAKEWWLTGLLKFLSIPMFMKVLGVAAICCIHQILIFFTPLFLILFALSDTMEEAFLKNGISETIEKGYAWLHMNPAAKKVFFVCAFPALFYFIVLTILQNAALKLVTDRHVSAIILATICIPILSSQALWKSFDAFRRWFPWYPPYLEATMEYRIKVPALSLVTIAGIGSLIVLGDLYFPHIVRFILGRNVSLKTFVAGVGTSFAVTMAVVCIMVDSKFKLKSVSEYEGWTEEEIESYYHQILFVSCSIVAFTFIMFPIFNKPYFAIQMMRVSLLD